MRLFSLIRSHDQLISEDNFEAEVDIVQYHARGSRYSNRNVNNY